MLRRGALLALTLLGLMTAAPNAPQPLKLRDAEELALRNHPALLTSKALERASLEVPKEARSRMLPQVAGAVTAVGGLQDQSRIFAGGLSAPAILDRFATGVGVSQLITDFGRTGNLTRSAELRAGAQGEAVNASRAQIILQVDRAYYTALRSKAVLRVAEQTVDARRLVADQTATLAQSKLKSELDVTFARVNLEEARLLLSSAENEERAAMAELSNAIGTAAAGDYILSEEALLGELPSDVSPMVDDALKNRPEVRQARLEWESAQRFAKAERALSYPVLSAAGNLGYAPAHPDQYRGQWGVAGINLDIPVFTGGLFSARRAEATARADAAEQQVRELENRVARDVRVAYLAALNAWQRLQLTAQLLVQAEQSLKLAQARYDLGLSSIIELSQAQLNMTRAQIAQVSAKFDYQSQRIFLDYQAGAIK